jgi:hypothetical protein
MRLSGHHSRVGERDFRRLAEIAGLHRFTGPAYDKITVILQYQTGPRPSKRVRDPAGPPFGIVENHIAVAPLRAGLRPGRLSLSARLPYARAIYKVQISVTLKEQFLLAIAWEQRLVVPKLFAQRYNYLGMHKHQIHV